VTICHRHCTIIAAVLCLGIGATADAGRPDWLMTGGQRLPDVDLPAEAARGSGIAGELNPASLGAPGLLVPLADGRVLHATRQRVVDDRARDRKSWVGAFADEPGSLMVLARTRGAITGFITYGAETFEIRPARSGRHMIYTVDPTMLSQDEPLLRPDEMEEGSGATVDDTGTAVPEGAFVHDLLVVYTPASRARYGQATLESMIVAAVAAANQAYANSTVNIRLNLVGLQEIEYTETEYISQSISDLHGKADGQMDSVHVLRDLLGADMVSLVAEQNGCGVAFLMAPESASFASSAFSVVKSSCLSQHSLAHELGHNQGNMHDREHSDGPGAFEYSYGFRRCVTDGTGFRTVMGYNCVGAPRVTQFSNPDITYNGWPTGVSPDVDPANSADNARSMNETADTVAAFRTISTSAPLAASSLAASSLTQDSVRLVWADSSPDEAGFAVERSGNGVDFAEVATLGAGTTTYTDTGLTPLMTYWYRVRAFNSAGSSGVSNTVEVTLPDAPPAPPTDVAALDNADGSASVDWVDASSNETGFEIRREAWDGKRGVWKSATTVGTVPAGVTTIVDITGNGVFRYSIRALGLENASSYAGPAQVQVTGGSRGGGKGRTR
jgi:hypothetical protein